MKSIYPCLWFHSQAEEAANFYKTVFANAEIGSIARYGEAASKASGQKVGSVMTVMFSLEGQQFMGLNGGPIFSITPAISFFVSCETEEEVNNLWEKLSPGGKVRIELGEYPYSKRYGWIEDKFGVSWQLILVPKPGKQKIFPCLLFANKKFGKAAEAMDFYTSTFPNGKILSSQKAPPGEPYNNENAVMYGEFTLHDALFAAMDGPGKHDFDFTEALSFVVNCDTQEEIDELWTALSAVKESEQCGWLKDKYGVSWQITPAKWEDMVNDKNSAGVERMMEAMMHMKKLDMAKLQAAYDGK